ncbi:hypothetical protein [Paenibacillus paridis]|uniref:hypothetical protein n=1 Tax=Paenibacillus paridis TaxID=2583376 RepID=UPI001122DE89|nr:hypothetical protein [Paenibacillus paridis]
MFARKESANSVYNRLATKAAVLVWSLKTVNAVLQLRFTKLDTIIDFLKKHMKESTTNSDIIKEILKDIVDYVLENSGSNQAYHPFTDGQHRTGVYIEVKDRFLLKKETINTIVKARRNFENLVTELYREVYIAEPKPTKRDFCIYSGDKTAMSVIVFFKNAIDN